MSNVWRRPGGGRRMVPLAVRLVAAGAVGALVLAATPATAQAAAAVDCASQATGTLAVSPATVVIGQSVTVTWSVSTVTPCLSMTKVITGLGFLASVSSSGTRTVTPTGTGSLTWTLSVVSATTGLNYPLRQVTASVTPPPPPLAPVTPLAAALDTSGPMMIIMARPGDDAVLRDLQVSPGGRFPGWVAWPGNLRSVASETDGSGRVVQVGFNGNGTIFGAIQYGPGSTGWLEWTPIDGTASSLALARNENGLLELFATTTTGTVLHRTQSAVGSLAFGAWNTLPGQLTQLAAETNVDGRIELAGLNAAGQISHQSETGANTTSSWSGWTQLAGTLASIAMARNEDGQLAIFGTDPSGALSGRYQSAPNSPNWNNPFLVDDGHGGPVAAQANQDGRIELFGRDAAGALSARVQTTPNQLAFDAWQPLIQYAPTGTPTGSQHKVLVLPVTWAAGNGTPAAPPTKSIEEIIGMVDNRWWSEVSYGQFPGWQISGFGPIAINPPHLDDGTCGGGFENDISSQADYIAIHTGGLDMNAYESIIYWFSSIGKGCGFLGQWDSGGRILINGADEQSVAHELGHSQGLVHANMLKCLDLLGQPTTYSGNCTQSEYNDPNDTMGDHEFAGFNAFERDRLGWMSGRIADVPATGGSYTLSPLELTTPGLQALRLSDGTPLWIEYRVPVGIDAGHLPAPGVLVYTTYQGDHGTGTAILDMNPGTNPLFDINIPVGTTWISPTKNFTVTVDSQLSTGAHITIGLNRVLVPDVVGDSLSGALAALRDTGLTQGVIHNVVDKTCEKIDVVLNSGPTAGTLVKPGTAVSLDVSVAPTAPNGCS